MIIKTDMMFVLWNVFAVCWWLRQLLRDPYTARDGGRVELIGQYAIINSTLCLGASKVHVGRFHMLAQFPCLSSHAIVCPTDVIVGGGCDLMRWH